MQSRKEISRAVEAVNSRPYGAAGQARTPSGRRPQLASLALNVANSRWAEEALVESEERYRIVAETAIDAIVTIGEEGEILFANPSAERIFGYSAAEILGLSLTLLVPAYSPAEGRGGYQQREV